MTKNSESDQGTDRGQDAGDGAGRAGSGDGLLRAVAKHVLGDYDGGRPGPTVLALGGLHGNEPAGVEAAKRVLARLQRGDVEYRGRTVAA